MNAYPRFHVTIQSRRTTVSLDPIVADLLAVALDQTPGSVAAHTAIRVWLDKSLSEWVAFDPELPVSRQATRLALRRIADPALLHFLDRHQAPD